MHEQGLRAYDLSHVYDWLLVPAPSVAWWSLPWWTKHC